MKSVIVEDIKESLWAIIFVIIVFLGTWLGFRVGSFIEDLPNTGAFTSWELLNSPFKFTKIAYINSNIIWAQTADDKLFFLKFCKGMNPTACNQWAKTENIPDDAYSDDYSRMSKGKICPDSSAYPKKYPGEIAECARIYQLKGSGGNYTYFALLEDGTVWQWNPPSGTDVPVISIIVGPSIGLLLGVFVGIWVLRHKKKKG